ncbi:hypothetical protein M434DRAFT_34363 [Hypoxylon sp. CO27-5]|nr:hypothetical protein M434DRAFT_34363 [Hypoxylon sp. CO27-5]
MSIPIWSLDSASLFSHSLLIPDVANPERVRACLSSSLVLRGLRKRGYSRDCSIAQVVSIPSTASRVAAASRPGIRFVVLSVSNYLLMVSLNQPGLTNIANNHLLSKVTTQLSTSLRIYMDVTDHKPYVLEQTIWISPDVTSSSHIEATPQLIHIHSTTKGFFMTSKLIRAPSSAYQISPRDLPLISIFVDLDQNAPHIP